MPPRQLSRRQAALTNETSSTPLSRTAARTRASVTRKSPEGSEDGAQALRLTFKMPSSRLRQATSAADTPEPETAATSRSTRSKPRKSYVMESESDDVQDEDEAEGAKSSEADEMEEDQLATYDQDSEDAEEDNMDDEDVEMDDDADDGLPLGVAAPAPAPKSLKIRGPSAPSQQPAQPKVTVTPAKDSTLKSVEQKEMEMDDDDDDDEELSELGSEDEADEAGGDEDAEGEDMDDDMEDDEDDTRSPGGDSRASTPDINKLTKRQRGRMDLGGDFLQLPMEPQIKKHFTPEEHAMRRAEMARRRKNLSEKRNEEEKADTINRLLKKQAPKRRGKISQAEIEAQDRGDEEEEGVGVEEEEIRINPVYVRWVSSKDGCRVGVPAEWMGKPVGRVFGGEVGGGMKMVEEVEG